MRQMSAICFLMIAVLALNPAQAAPAPALQPDASRPWSAVPSNVVVVSNETFWSHGTRLSGTLYSPGGRDRHGAIVVFHGASSPLRSSPLYEHLIRVLPALGIAVFVYDRRGTGRSEGVPNSGDFPLLPDDGIAALRLLRTNPRIDPSRMGVWGLSQGGWLALLAASRSADVRFAVAISAPLVTPDVQMMFSSTNTLRVFGYSNADIEQMKATRKAVDDYMRGTDTKEHAQELLDAASTKAWFKYLYMGSHVTDRSISTWRREISNDPMPILAKVHVPLLVLYGAADPVIPVSLSRQRLQTFVPTHPKMAVAIVAEADHGMQIGVDPKHLLDPSAADEERPNSEEYIARLASWLTRIGVAKH